MKKAAFSGTLDPITNGQLWVIGEARALADEVAISIAENPFLVRGLQGPIGWHWSMRKSVPEPAYNAGVLVWLRAQWEQLWNYSALTEAGIANADHWFTQLTGDSAYGAPERHYHNLDHLVHGLTELTVWAANVEASNPSLDVLKAAFWFHDAVYDVPKQGVSNEEASARLWLCAGLPCANTEEVASLIRMTDHAQQHALDHPLKHVMLGADLAILGQSDAIYQVYIESIRREYTWVEDQAYRAGRKAVLQHFLAAARAGTLYVDPYFKDLYETLAERNLEREIAVL